MLQDFPDEILLEIFKHIHNVKDKMICATVCQRWHHLIYSKSLWKNITLNYSLAPHCTTISVKKLNLLLNHGPAETLTFRGIVVINDNDGTISFPHLTSLTIKNSNNIGWNMYPQDILFKCPNLTVLHLTGFFVEKDILENILYPMSQLKDLSIWLRQRTVENCPFKGQTVVRWGEHLEKLSLCIGDDSFSSSEEEEDDYEYNLGDFFSCLFSLMGKDNHLKKLHVQASFLFWYDQMHLHLLPRLEQLDLDGVEFDDNLLQDLFHPSLRQVTLAHYFKNKTDMPKCVDSKGLNTFLRLNQSNLEELTLYDFKVTAETLKLTFWTQQHKKIIMEENKVSILKMKHGKIIELIL